MNTVKETLRRLASKGLVERHPWAGACVSEPSRQDHDELYVLRDTTQSYAAAEAANHASDEPLGEMDEILARSAR